jgi:hypothetical protein
MRRAGEGIPPAAGSGDGCVHGVPKASDGP